MSPIDLIFEGEPKVLCADRAAELIGFTRHTIYQMKFNPKKFDVPDGLFLKNGGRLLVVTEILKQWLIKRSTEQEE